MKTNRFKQFLSIVPELNSNQFRQLQESVKGQVLRNKVEANLETKFENLNCPHCSSSKKVRWGKRSGMQRYKCKTCHKTFNSLSGTPLARLRKKEQWLEYSSCLIEGTSIRKSASRCKVNKNTSFRWRHRFLSNANKVLPTSLNGIVEAEEMYFLKSEKGNKNIQRKARKRGGQVSQREMRNEKVCVLVCRDRNKNTFDKLLESFNSKSLKQELENRIDRDALFCSDGKSVYKKFTKELGFRHGCLKLSKGQHVIKEIVHIKNTNAYHNNFKEWLKHFHGVATKYMENYLSWFRELDEFKTEIKPEFLLLRAKRVGEYKSQPLTIT